MTRQRSEYWTYLQAVAWVRWRTLETVKIFSGPGASELWRAMKLFGDAQAGLADLQPRIAAASAESQFRRALVEGAIVAVGIDGIEETEIPASVLSDARVTTHSTLVRAGELVARRVVFDSKAVQGAWPARSPARDQEASLMIVEAWLRDMMQGPKPPDVTRDTLFDVRPSGITKKAFRNLYTRVANEENPDWSLSGRPPKAT